MVAKSIPGLAWIVAAWEGLPAALQAAMLAIVDSAGARKSVHVEKNAARNSG